MTTSAGAMTPRAWALFAAMGVIWGLPYLFIKIAGEELSPPVLVALRTAIGALVLVPIALHRRSVGLTLARWKPVLAFAGIEIAIPWLLLNHAEQRITSGLAGLMIAAVPLIGALAARVAGDRLALARVRMLGLATGLLGVTALIGLDSLAGHLDPLSIAEMLGVAVCYALAPMIAVRYLAGVPAVGVIAVSLVAVTIVYAPWAVWVAPRSLPSGSVLFAVAFLGIVCTALAFVLFFELIAAVGNVRATVITFVNPAVAILLGLIVLSEPLTVGMAIGFPLVLLGSWWATRPVGAADERPPGAASRPETDAFPTTGIATASPDQPNPVTQEAL